MDWRSADPQHPLGRGMPPGRALRLDGESHDDWWKRVLRADPCAYCDVAVSGTVDHIVPRSTRQVGVNAYGNLIGACSRCNGHKKTRTLLGFLRVRNASRKRARRP
jgi:5-methylcytosine-specific restriction endonuclease McrA